MRHNVLEEMHNIVDNYFLEADLNILLKQFIAEKAAEGSRWSDITGYIHLMLGGTSVQVDRLSAITELVILCSDIIDDLQDQDNRRKPWMTCPPGFAMNAVLSFLIAFIGELGELNACQVNGKLYISELSQILARSITGQQKDLNGFVQTEADYIEMVQLKSGSLIRFACSMGFWFITNLSAETVDQINELAQMISVILQIENDLNDVLGFEIKNDLLQKKRTLPILFLLEDCSAEFPPLAQYYQGEISEQEFLASKQACIRYIQDSGCVEYSRIIQSLFIEKAEVIYESISGISPWKEKFKEITFALR